MPGLLGFFIKLFSVKKKKKKKNFLSYSFAPVCVDETAEEKLLLIYHLICSSFPATMSWYPIIKLVLQNYLTQILFVLIRPNSWASNQIQVYLKPRCAVFPVFHVGISKYVVANHRAKGEVSKIIATGPHLFTS